VSHPLSPKPSSLRLVLSSIRLHVSARRLYVSGVAMLIFASLGAAATKGTRPKPPTTGRFDQCRTQPVDSGVFVQSVFPPEVDTTVVFGPRQFVTVKNSTQINFAESFSVPASSTPNATEYMIRLQRVGGKLTTATVSINGAPVAVTADFASATTIERLITVNQTNPNTNSVTLSLKGDAGAGIRVTIFGFPNSSFDVFGPKPYTMMSLSPTCYEESFLVPADAAPPYRIIATASASGTKANIYLNDVKVLAVSDFGTTAPIMRTVGLVSGSNTIRVQITGTAGTTITLRLTAKDTIKPAITITSPPPNLITNAATLPVTGSVQARTPTTVKVNGVAATMSGAGNTQFSATIPLTEGTNTVLISATNQAGIRTDSTRTVIRDSQAPTLTLTSPADGSYTNQAAATVSGTVGGGGTAVTVKVNGVTFPVGTGGTFSGSYQLTAGANFLTAVATDQAGNSSSVTNKVTLDSEAPAITISAPAQGLITKQTSAAVSGTVTDASPTTVTVNGVSAPVGTGGSFSVTVPVNTEGSNAITVVATDAASNQSTASRSIIRDTQAPVLTIASPAAGFLTNQSTVSVSGTVADATALTLTANGVALTVDASGNYTGQVPLAAEGANVIAFVATDAATNQSTQSRNVVRDTQAPVLNLTAPTDNSVTKTSTLSLVGNVFDASPVAVNVNGAPVIVDGTGALSGSVTLVEGANILNVVATDGAGNSANQVRRVTLDTQAPVITISAPTDGSTIATASVVTSGNVGDASATTLTVNGASFALGAAGAFSGEVALTTGPNTLSYAATDAAGNVGTASRTVTRQLPGPPDPVAVATAVNPAEVTLMQENTAFLYAGANPVQTGVAPGTIAFLRAAVLRGKVLDRALAPLGEVVVTVKDHPELGRTTTRSDGAYDLAVNGGGTLVLVFAKATYLPAQRGVAVAWQDYTTVDSVILLQPDPAVTTVNLTTDTIQVAQASVQSDADGPRHATVFFEPGTQATLRRADGTTEILTSLDIRATEFTVGANGGAAMPGDLPPSSQYTYAVQVTADQQLAAGPGAVLTFSKPVPLYVENFLDFPVGTAVPSGVYNPVAGAWQPRPNGVVLKILGKDAQNRALLDINGDGVADSDSLLVFNGIDPLERIKLAGTYPLGSALWRVQIIETLPHDLNWPYVILGGDAPRSSVKGPCGSEGADVLRCSLQVQTAFQSVGIVGSPFTLNYASDRTQGNVADRQLDIKLIGATVPQFLERVDMEIDIAGKRFEASFTPTANLSYQFVWDGKDAYGRTVQATQPANVRISYMYPVLYGVPAPVNQSFGLPCMTITGACPLTGDIRESIRALRRVAETVQTTLGTFDATGAGLGGFTLNVQHAYDPIGGQFYSGDGTRRVAATLPDQVTRWAGTGNGGTTGSQIANNVLKTLSIVTDPAGIVVAPDGSVIFVDRGRARIRKVSPDGIITTIAGTGVSEFNGDDRLATTAALTNPWALALGPDGSLYVGEQSSRHAIRRIGPDGFIRKVAGDGTCGSTGDNGPADSARVCQVFGMGLGPDGSLYFAESTNNRIRKIGPDGIIRTVAGTGVACFTTGSVPADSTLFVKTPAQGGCGEGIPATQARLRLPTGLTVGPDGTVYFAQQAGGAFAPRLRRIDPAGFIYVVAGGDVAPTQLGEGGSAKQAQLGNLAFSGMTVGPDGSVYFSSEAVGLPPEQYVRVRRVRPDGRITTVAGDGTSGTPLGDNGPARRARLGRVEGLAFTAAGDLLMSDDAEVRLVSAPLPGLASGSTVIASPDGGELYVFSPAGRILLTLDAVTRDTINKFAYNPARQLISVVDQNGRTLTVARDGAGRPTALVSPDGQRTELVVNGDGNLTSAVGDAGALVLAYGDGGQIGGSTDAGGATVGYTYDANGQLVGSVDPDGVAKSMVLSQTATGQTTTFRSATGLETTLRVETGAVGERVVTTTDPAGVASTATGTQNGVVVSRAANGTVTTTTQRPDPLFGMEAPQEQVTAVTPSGLTRVTRTGIAVTLADPNDPSTIVTQTDSVIVNGRASTSVFNTQTLTTTITSPQGRSAFTTDSSGYLVRDSVPGFVATRYRYDNSGRQIEVRHGSRAVGIEYGDLGRPVGATDLLGRRQTIAYDAAGRISAQVFADGRSIRYDYDANASSIAITPPGKAAHRFSFTPGGRAATYAAPDGVGTTIIASYAYDSVGRQVTQTFADGAALHREYDGTGRLAAIRLPDGSRRMFDYDNATGRVIRATEPGGQALFYEYDGMLVTRVTSSGTVAGSVAVTHDNDFRVISQVVNGLESTRTSYGYDGDGLVISAGALSIGYRPHSDHFGSLALGGLTTIYDVDTLGERRSEITTFGGVPRFDARYTRDQAGRLTKIEEIVEGESTTQDYTYDAAGRLETVLLNGVLSASYEYDQNGNRLRVTSPTGVLVGTVDVQDRLVAYGDATYQYDARGNLRLKTIGGDATQYNFALLGALSGVTFGDGTRIDYVVDAQGRRVGTKLNGALVRAFVYSGTLAPVAELDATGNIVARFVYATRPNVPDFIVRDGRTYRVITDHLGSVRLVLDAQTGELAQRMDYDAFGRVVRDTRPGFQPFGFGGGLFDGRTSLVHFGAREYDPETGRWLSKDPQLFLAADPNLYAYVANDPVNSVDPTGLNSLMELMFTEAASNVLQDALLASLTGEPYSAADALKSAAIGAIGVGAISQMGKVRAMIGVAERARMLANGRQLVYLHYAEEGIVDYVGSTKRGWERILEHLVSPRGKELGWTAGRFRTIPLPNYSAYDLKAVEQALIEHYGGASTKLIDRGTDLLNKYNVFAKDTDRYYDAISRGREILLEIGFPLR